MKTLVTILRAAHRDVLLPLEDAFNRYRDLGEAQVDLFSGSRDEHALLAAFRVLLGRGYYFPDPDNVDDFDSLVGILKRCPEVNHESVQARRPRPRKRAVRVHRRA